MITLIYFQKLHVNYDEYDVDADISAEFDFGKIEINASFAMNITEKTNWNHNTTYVEVKINLLNNFSK